MWYFSLFFFSNGKSADGKILQFCQRSCRSQGLFSIKCEIYANKKKPKKKRPVCSCRSSLTVFHGGVFFSCLTPNYILRCLFLFLFYNQSSEEKKKKKHSTQHSPFQECGGVLHHDCNTRLGRLMFARCSGPVARHQKNPTPPAGYGG